MFALLGCGAVSPKNEPKISMTEFNTIKVGMTYEQVTAIVGAPGDMVLESGTPGDKFHTAEYRFKGDGDMWGAYAQLLFQDGP